MGSPPSWFSVLTISFTLITNTVFCSFNCENKQCCSYKSAVIPSDANINCNILSVEDCIEIFGYMCQWDCSPTQTNTIDTTLRNAGFTIKTYKKISKGDGEYHEPKIKGNSPPTSLHGEPQTVDQVIKYTKIESVDECGVVYEYEMDQISAANELQRLIQDDEKQEGETDTNPSLINALIRRLTVFGNDGRSRVTNSLSFGFSGYLQFSTANGNEKRCSASLLSSTWIITAAHCVHSGVGAWNAEWFSNWRFYPAAVHGDSAYLQSIELKGVTAYTFGEWTNVYGPNWDYDIGWININGAGNGHVSNPNNIISINYNDNLQHGEYFHTVGYPGDKTWLTQWYQSCDWVYIVEEFMVTESCDIFAGSSGSPVYRHLSGARKEVNCIVSWENEYFNGCARITHSKYDVICSFVGCV